jgi:hypothetical protein
MGGSMLNPDIDRTNELKAKVWAHQARNLLLNKSHPDEIEKRSIEYNKGRIEKALRLLDGYVSYARTPLKGSYDKIYQIRGFDESAALAVAPVYAPTWRNLHDAMFPTNEGSQEEFDTIRYDDINKISATGILYIYWHQDEYHLVKVDKCLMVYPKALLQERIKCMLRAIVEQHLQDDFPHKLETYLHLPVDSVKTEDHFFLSIRNFAGHAFRFTEAEYFGDKGFLEEYTHFRDYFEALIKNLTSINDLATAAGGHATIIEEMRKDTITKFLKMAPLHAFQKDIEDGEKKYVGHDDHIQKSYKNPFLNTFLLRHAEHFVYEYLYDTDKSISPIINHKTRQAEETLFEPNKEELAMIASMRKEAAACTMKTTLKTLQHT